MTSSWRRCSLGELLRIKHGWPFKSDSFALELTGLPIVVSIGNFDYAGGFRVGNTTWKEYRGDYPKEYELDPGDILVVMTCQTPGGEILGLPARVPDDGRTYLHNQRIGKVVISEPEAVSADFVYWLFLWRELNKELVASSSGTKIVHTAPSRIEAFEFDLPSIHEQNGIARLLWSIEAKLQSNRRMNHTLEATAAALFRSWFVDFDPVVAKAEGRRALGVSPALHERVPSAFASGLGDSLPNGWRIGTIRDLASFVNGRNFTTRASGVGRMVIRIAELGGEARGSTVFNDVAASDENIARAGDLLFSWSGSLRVARWHGEESLINQHIFKVICSTWPQWFVHHHLDFALPQFQEIAAGKATTMGHIKREHLSQVRVALPPSQVVESAADVIEPLYLRIHSNERENRTLAALRDTLLPQLLSGAIRLRDAERAVGAAV